MVSNSKLTPASMPRISTFISTARPTLAWGDLILPAGGALGFWAPPQWQRHLCREPLESGPVSARSLWSGPHAGFTSPAHSRHDKPSRRTGSDAADVRSLPAFGKNRGQLAAEREIGRAHV